MDDGVAQLAEVIAAHLREWSAVDAAIFGSDDARAIAVEIDRFCRDELRAPVARGLFHETSQGSVTAVELADGRRVVVKAHRPDEDLAMLQEIVRVQMHLASRGLWATTVCGGPAPLGRGLGIVEAFVSDGATRDGRDPAVRAALVRGFQAIVAACRPLVAGSTLPRHYLARVADDALWPAGLDTSERGVEWIDEVARAARARMQPAGEWVIGHGDWRVQHVRFEGDEIVAAFDWAGLCKEREPALVGFTAFAFCVDWSRAPVPVTPLDDARAFVADYEAARGRAFAADERQQCGAMFAYSYAYLARCLPGPFRDLVASHGPALIEL
jgi:hypothetical protein